MMAENKEAKAEQTPFDLEALKEQIKAELKEEAEQKAAEAEAEKIESEAQTKPDPYYEEYVEVRLFKDNKDYKDDVFVAVNGENCLIQRGVPVKIKRKFALVLENSDAQDLAAVQYAQGMQDEFAKQARAFGA